MNVATYQTFNECVPMSMHNNVMSLIRPNAKRLNDKRFIIVTIKVLNF